MEFRLRPLGFMEIFTEQLTFKRVCVCVYACV